MQNIITLDVETQFSAQEVGGWSHIDKMKIACVVIHSSLTDEYKTFLEDEVPELVEELKKADLIVGFNIKNFDYTVIQPYINFDLETLQTLDILEYFFQRSGFRVSLDACAGATLGTQKSANGLISLEWWKAGEVQKVIDYCKKDVEVTKDLYLYGKKHGKIFYADKKKVKKSCYVHWD